MRRQFSREFKFEVCRAADSGLVSKARLCREHALSGTLLDRWLEQFHAKGEDAFAGKDWRQDTVLPQSRVRELESALGRAHLEIEFLKEALGKLGARRGKSE